MILPGNLEDATDHITSQDYFLILKTLIYFPCNKQFINRIAWAIFANTKTLASSGSTPKCWALVLASTALSCK